MKRKSYHYKDELYLRKVKFVGAYAGVIGLFALGSFLFFNMNFLMIPVVIVCAYTYWETYVSLSNPQDIVIDDKSITFSGCGKVHTYNWKEIKNFRVKEFYSNHKVFVRINEAGIFKGRYWVACDNFNDTEELFQFFLDKEYALHPTSMKAVARRTNEDSFNERKKAAELKEAEQKNK